MPKLTISFMSRGHTRDGHSWSTRSLDQKLAANNFEMSPRYDGTLVQKVVLEGTKEHIVEQRDRLLGILRLVMGPKAPIMKELEEEEEV